MHSTLDTFEFEEAIAKIARVNSFYATAFGNAQSKILNISISLRSGTMKLTIGIDSVLL